MTWDELRDADPDDYTIATVPDFVAKPRRPWADIDSVAQSLEPLLEMVEADEEQRARRPAVSAELPEDAGRTAPRAAEQEGGRQLG